MNYLQRRLVFTEAEVNMISKVIEYCKEHDKSPINKLTASGIYSKLTNQRNHLFRKIYWFYYNKSI